MPVARLVLALLLVSAAASADATISELLTARIRAHLQQLRAHASEGRELQAAVDRFKAEDQAIAAEKVALEQQLRDELHAVKDAVCHLETSTCTAPAKSAKEKN